jgi:hypothetical protein
MIVAVEAARTVRPRCGPRATQPRRRGTARRLAARARAPDNRSRGAPPARRSRMVRRVDATTVRGSAEAGHHPHEPVDGIGSAARLGAIQS